MIACTRILKSNLFLWCMSWKDFLEFNSGNQSFVWTDPASLLVFWVHLVFHCLRSSCRMSYLIEDSGLNGMSCGSSSASTSSAIAPDLAAASAKLFPLNSVPSRCALTHLRVTSPGRNFAASFKRKTEASTVLDFIWLDAKAFRHDCESMLIVADLIANSSP